MGSDQTPLDAIERAAAHWAAVQDVLAAAHWAAVQDILAAALPRRPADANDPVIRLAPGDHAALEAADAEIACDDFACRLTTHPHAGRVAGMAV